MGLHSRTPRSPLMPSNQIRQTQPLIQSHVCPMAPATDVVRADPRIPFTSKARNNSGLAKRLSPAIAAWHRPSTLVHLHQQRHKLRGNQRHLLPQLRELPRPVMFPPQASPPSVIPAIRKRGSIRNEPQMDAR